MNERIGIRSLSLLFVVAVFFFSPTSRAQDNSDEVKGVDSGNYNVQQTVELGYRGNWINGNQDTYDTFVNLGSGPRLLDCHFPKPMPIQGRAGPPTRHWQCKAPVNARIAKKLSSNGSEGPSPRLWHP